MVIVWIIAHIVLTALIAKQEISFEPIIFMPQDINEERWFALSRILLLTVAAFGSFFIVQLLVYELANLLPRSHEGQASNLALLGFLYAPIHIVAAVCLRFYFSERYKERTLIKIGCEHGC